MENANNAAMNALSDLAEAMLASVKPQIDQAIEREIEAQKAKIGVRKIVICSPDGERKIEGHTNAIFEHVLKIVNAGLYPMIVGPAGCGKTHLSAQIAKALGLRYYAESVSEATSEATLFGRLLPVAEGGTFQFCEGPFLNFLENGGLFCFDEMDAGSPNAFTAINAPLANDQYFCAMRAATGGKAYVKKHPEFRAIACANTFGNGGSVMYAGRNQLDAATLDRFVMIHMDYDLAFEAALAPSYVSEFVWKIRERIAQNNMRKIASTRMIVKMGAMVEAGISFKDAKKFILTDWSRDDLARIGEA